MLWFSLKRHTAMIDCEGLSLLSRFISRRWLTKQDLHTTTLEVQQTVQTNRTKNVQ